MDLDRKRLVDRDNNEDQSSKVWRIGRKLQSIGSILSGQAEEECSTDLVGLGFILTELSDELIAYAIQLDSRGQEISK